MGSLIPLPSFEAWETDQIKLQAMRYVVTLKSYRATVICGIGFGGTLPRCHYFSYFSILQMSLLHKAGNAVRIAVLITVNAN